MRLFGFWLAGKGYGNDSGVTPRNGPAPHPHERSDRRRAISVDERLGVDGDRVLEVRLPVANGQKTTLSLPVRRSVAQKWRISPCRDEFDRPGAFIPKLAAAVDFQDVGFGMRIRTAERPNAGKSKAFSREFRKGPESGRPALELFLVRLLREGRIARNVP
jgi:hypothetical protein